MALHDVWFVIIAVLWTGYFFLEGFDFGVGVLTRLLAGDETERRVLINTIGPVWDGNEVWLISAAGATFAAFPDWYATLFSGFYLPFLLMLVALILRAVAFEYRGKRHDAAWKRNWERAIFWCSLLPAVLWGVIFADIARGVPIDAHQEYAGGLGDLLHPYALLGGLVSLSLFTLHGAVFVALKTEGPIRHRARRLAGRLWLLAAPATLGFLAWTQTHRETWRALPALGVAALALAVLVPLANRRGREGLAFAGTGIAVVGTLATIFCSLYPAVLPSTLAPAWDLTVSNASSAPYTLKIMTVVACLLTPVVLAYQGWTYWVFRKRIGVRHIPGQAASRAVTSAKPPAAAPGSRPPARLGDNG